MQYHSSDGQSASTNDGGRNAPGQLSENTPLLTNPHTSCVEETLYSDPSLRESNWTLFLNEFLILTKYGIPVFLYVVIQLHDAFADMHYSTGGLEFSLVIVSVITIGHISTTALAAITLGSMTASVTGFSIIQGLVSALDTLLPPAWTSPHPQLVGLWAQRMS